jgi:hypothetical protein
MVMMPKHENHLCTRSMYDSIIFRLRLVNQGKMMSYAPVIVLLTDFGLDDAYVGVMKGVILRICPQVHLIDLCHTVQPQQIRQAAFLLANAYAYFPKGTIFLVVVDPGVGSSRKAIAVHAGDYTFVAPDNGVLSYTLEKIGEVAVAEISNRDYFRKQVSSTFHGRDIFAPVAAHLASGVSFEALGDALSDMVILPQPVLIVGNGTVTGEVINIDHFGNIITSIGHLSLNADTCAELDAAFVKEVMNIFRIPNACSIRLHKTHIQGLHHTYSDAPLNEAFALINSDGFLEIAVRSGNAARQLDVQIGDPVEIVFG